jgi:secondary thiamine-phosphate synthase enzyme
VLVSSPHTTAGVIVNEGYDPDVVGDLVRRLERLAPREGQGDRHAEGNSDAHMVVALGGSSVLLPIADGGLALGRWQRIFLVEWDGPRSRRLHVSRV